MWSLRLLTAVLILCTSCTTDPVQSSGTEQHLWPESKTPTVLSDPAGDPMEVGTEFMPASDGEITAIRFYQGPDNTGATVATLWASNGTKLASATIPPGRDGWREVRLPQPIPIDAARGYVVSYQASRGHFSTDPDTFAEGRRAKSGWLTATGGVHAKGNGFPDESSQGTNYYVDPVFRPSGPSLRPVDGGEKYFDQFHNSFPTTPEFFPLGVWFTYATSADQIASDRALGINTYVMVTSDSDLNLIKQSGMFSLTETANDNAAGQLLTDEADMWAGAGDAPWTGRTGYAEPGNPTCIPEDAECGYTVMKQLQLPVPRHILTYANYGKGVTFWESKENAARFVNDFQKLVSADNYWFTDRNICQAEEGGALKNHGTADLSPEDCQLAANYGLTTAYVRSLVRPWGAMPVWNFVELGHPSTKDEGGAITGPQMRAAVWSSIINGARGIVYFVHNFGGPCLSNNLLRDQCGDAIRGDVAAVNQQIGRLAPVLNAPSVDGFARSDGPVDLAVKKYGDALFVIAGATQNQPFEATINTSCGSAGSAEVVDEQRRVPMSEGRSFRDTFADGNAVHIYRIDSVDGCSFS